MIRIMVTRLAENLTSQNFSNILLHWLLVVAYIVVSMITESLLSPEIISDLDTQLNTPITLFEIILLIIAAIYYIFCIVLSVGLFLFKKWAKTILLPSYVLSSLFFLLFFNTKPVIETGWASFLGDILSLVEGIILALVYFSPISRAFEVNRHTTRSY